jgi:hypothetical protein
LYGLLAALAVVAVFPAWATAHYDKRVTSDACRLISKAEASSIVRQPTVYIAGPIRQICVLYWRRGADYYYYNVTIALTLGSQGRKEFYDRLADWKTKRASVVTMLGGFGGPAFQVDAKGPDPARNRLVFVLNNSGNLELESPSSSPHLLPTFAQLRALAKAMNKRF